VTPRAAAIRAERDRFVALAFCWADVLIELDENEHVVFAAGATRPLLGRHADDLVGSALVDLVAAQDQALLRSLLGIARQRGRIENAAVRLQGGSGPTAPLPFAGYRLDELDNHYFLAFRVGAASPRKGVTGHLTRDTASGLYDAQSFTDVVSGILKAQQAHAEAAQVTLIALPDYEELRERLDGEAEHGFLDSLGAYLRANSLDGDSAARIADDRYGLLHRADLDITDLEGRVVEMSRDLDPAGKGISVESATMDSSRDGASDEDLANGLVYAINRFRHARGHDFSIKSLSTSLSSLVNQAVTSVNSFKKVVAAARFNIAFQPILDAVTGEIHHYEALARFGGDDRDQSPYERIVFAEETGLIQEFDMAMVSKIIALLSKVPSDKRFRVAVNVSGHSVASSSYVSSLHALLRDNVWTRNCLMFEITESARLDDLATAGRFIQSLRGEGYKVCLDDFGAGAANFQYLSTLEVDVVKLDGLAVRNAESAPKGKAFLRALTSLCRDLGVQTIAEMVDDRRSLEFIRQCAVNYVQGYLFGRPSTDIRVFERQRQPHLFAGRVAR